MLERFKLRWRDRHAVRIIALLERLDTKDLKDIADYAHELYLLRCRRAASS